MVLSVLMFFLTLCFFGCCCCRSCAADLDVLDGDFFDCIHKFVLNKFGLLKYPFFEIVWNRSFLLLPLVVILTEMRSVSVSLTSVFISGHFLSYVYLFSYVYFSFESFLFTFSLSNHSLLSGHFC